MALNQSQINQLAQKMYNLDPIVKTIDIQGDTSIAFVAATDRIESASLNFVGLGFKAGMFITVGGSAANSGIHKVNSVDSGGVGVDSSLTNEIAGPAIDIDDEQNVINQLAANNSNRRFADQADANKTMLQMFNER